MNKDEIKKTVQSWLDKNQPEGIRIIISCGSAGALVATKQAAEWQTTWADNVIIYSDIDNQHRAARILQTEENVSVDSDIYSCHCGRTFTKRFALTNHQKICKQVPSEVIPKPVDEIMDGINTPA